MYCLICSDKKDSLDLRMQNREEHLKYVQDSGLVFFAGPLLSEKDVMVGSLIILNVANRSEAKEWSKNDPYKRAGLFKNIKIIKFKHLI